MNTRKVRLVKGDNNACPKCGSVDIVSRTYADTVDFRNLEFNVEGLLDSKCQHCGHVWSTSDQETSNSALIRGVYASERDRLRAEQGLLSGNDIAQIRERLELNQREAAALFGGGYNAFNKYESGEVLQSFAMDRLLRLSKLIGKPAVAFLRDVDAPPLFTLISTASTFTASDTSFNLASASGKMIGAILRSVQTSTDSAISPVVVRLRETAHSSRNENENYALGC